MTFAITDDPRCRPHVVRVVSSGGVRALCGYQLRRNVRVLDNVRGFRPICRACATAGPVVYQAFARDGRVLYVGRTKILARRLAQHQARSRWWAEAVEISTRRFATEQEAARQEAWLIQSLRPRDNRLYPVSA